MRKYITKEMFEMKEKEVVIIGAGPAGITAGYELIKNNKFKVTLLEESNYIGGISRTEEYKGNRIDIGGHRFFSKSKRVNDWWDEVLSYENKDISIKKEKMSIVKRISTIIYDKKIYDYPIKLNKRTIKNLGLINIFEVIISYIGSSLHKRKETSLEAFYINRFGKKLYEIFFKDYTEKVWGVLPSEISPDWGIQRVKGLSIKEVIRNVVFKKSKEISLIEEFKYPKYGPGSLWEKAGQILVSNGGEIKNNCKVVKLYEKNNKIYKLDYIENGEIKEIEGDIFISSMPLKDLVSSLNNVPKEVYSVSNNLQYRDYITVGVLIEKNNVKFNNGEISDCWMYIQDKSLKVGRIQVYNNWSSDLVKFNDKYMWLGLEYYVNEDDDYWNKKDEDWLELVSYELCKLNFINKKEVIEDYKVIREKKAYPSYTGSYEKLDIVINYLNTYENLFCIGRNGQHRYNNMDHSMMTAFETVNNIVNNKVNKENIWDVNTKKEYHESIKGNCNE